MRLVVSTSKIPSVSTLRMVLDLADFPEELIDQLGLEEIDLLFPEDVEERTSFENLQSFCEYLGVETELSSTSLSLNMPPLVGLAAAVFANPRVDDLITTRLSKLLSDLVVVMAQQRGNPPVDISTVETLVSDLRAQSIEKMAM